MHEENVCGKSGQLAIVTGAAGGIGRPIVRQLLREGARVAAVDMGEFDIAVDAGRDRLFCFSCDATNQEAIKATSARIRRELGDPDILVNTVGGSGATRVREIEEVTDEIWYRVMDLNLTSALRFIREVAAGMRLKRYGRIVNISSTVRAGVPGPLNTLAARLPYVVAKCAIDGLTRQLAKDLGSHGITVNAVAPGMIIGEDGTRLAKIFKALEPKTQESIVGTSASGRYGTGEDVAAVICFLASKEAAYVSGEVVEINGG